MSSMKSFKSRISQKRGDSRSKINMSSQSVADFNLKNVQMTANNSLQFRLERSGQRILVTPFRLHITNNSGCTIFLHANASRDEYFNISPKKYLLENGSTYEVTFRLIEMSGVQLQDYARQTFTIYWGRISQSDIENKIIPQMNEYRVFKCTFINKELIDQLLVKKTYQNIPRPSHNDRSVSRNQNFLSASNLGGMSDEKSQFMKSKQNMSDLNTFNDGPKQSLLRINVIIGVAIVSFIIGFLSS